MPEMEKKMNLENLEKTNRYKLLKLFGVRCRTCPENKPENLDIDHIYNDGANERTKYGSNEKIYGWYLQHESKAFERLQPLCKECHGEKHSSFNMKENEIDLSVLQSKYPSEVSRMQLSMDTLSELEGELKKPVEERILIQEIIKSGKFNEEESRNYIRRMLRNASIYESKPGFYNRV